MLGIFAEMTLKGLIALARIAMAGIAGDAKLTSAPALSAGGVGEIPARMFAASVLSAALIIFAFAHAPFRKSSGQIAAGLIVGLLVAAGWYATGYPAPMISTDPGDLADLHRADRDALQYVMLSTDRR